MYLKRIVFAAVLICLLPLYSGADTTNTADFFSGNSLYAQLSVDCGSNDEEDNSLLLGQRTRRRKNNGGVVWVSTYGAVTSMDDAEYNDYSSKTTVYGVAAGYDVKIGSKALERIGFFYNYNNSETECGDISTFGTKDKTDTHLAGMTFTKYFAFVHFFLKGSVGYDKNTIELPGDGIVTPGNPQPNWSGNSLQGNFHGEFGFDFCPSDNSWAIKPYLAIEYNYLKMDEMKEGYYNITLPEEDYSAFKTQVGVRVNKRFHNLVQVQVRGAWIQQLLKNNDPINTLNYSTFMGTQTPTMFYGNKKCYGVRDPLVGRGWITLGAGVKIGSDQQKWRIFLDYDPMFNEYRSSHVFSASFLLTW
ncbi:MAG: autotransporter outer membrane beta-barrel domain-containing protein [Planctomycetaceae bacterium]|jgi:outer membrane autotransporter protein|nr:autotransporter outer membrane beta-barrel domain-containing protein [Planctomycetaceae bacterium]